LWILLGSKDFLLQHIIDFGRIFSVDIAKLIKARLCIAAVCGVTAISALSGCAVRGGADNPYSTRFLNADGSVSEREIREQTTYKGPLFDWHGDHLTGKVKIVIDLNVQRANIYRGGELAGWTLVATGREGFGTPAGQFTVVEKVVDKRSTLYGQIVDASGAVIVSDADSRRDKPPAGGAFVGAPMPYWMRLTWRGVGMHAGPIPQPGEPASHGCIRLPYEMAVRMHDLVSIGTPVQVVR